MNMNELDLSSRRCVCFRVFVVDGVLLAAASLPLQLLLLVRPPFWPLPLPLRMLLSSLLWHRYKCRRSRDEHAQPHTSSMAIGTIVTIMIVVGSELGDLCSQVTCTTASGESVGIIGSVEALGSWKDSAVVSMTVGSDSEWSSPPLKLGGGEVEYKFVVLGEDKASGRTIPRPTQNAPRILATFDEHIVCGGPSHGLKRPDNVLETCALFEAFFRERCSTLQHTHRRSVEQGKLPKHSV